MKYCVIHNISPHSQSDNKTYPSLADVQNTVKDIKNENVPHFNLHTGVPLFPDDEYVMWFWGKNLNLWCFFFHFPPALSVRISLTKESAETFGGNQVKNGWCQHHKV